MNDYALEARCLAAAREILAVTENSGDLALGSHLRDDPFDLRDLVAELEDLADDTAPVERCAWCGVLAGDGCWHDPAPGAST